MKKCPLVSVIMPVHNGELYLEEAIQSILDQSYTNFEFIIIDDASTDRSLEIIKSYSDPRIQILINRNNLGHHKSRNNGLHVAKGKYIAVMDADDIAYPNRLERQVLYMEQNINVGIAGSCARFVGSPTNEFYETNSEILKVSLLLNCFMCHPSIMMRSEMLKMYNLFYDESLWYSGDYNLQIRAVKYFMVVNMNEILMQYRWSPNQMSASYPKYWTELVRNRLQQLINFGIELTDEEKQIHLGLLEGELKNDTRAKALQWVEKLINANRKVKYYNQKYLEDFLEAMLAKSALKLDLE